jgi:ParB-like chromosome segregation protein Spo0J
MRGVAKIVIKNINKVKEIDVETVASNITLAAAVDRRSVERCKEAIEKLGIVHTPVIGATKSGKRVLLSGQCELTALRELGVKKMDAIELDAAGDGAVSAKLSLLLISLKDRPGALCEGLLLQEAVSAGVSRQEIQTMLGKSASWVSNRISLVTRLDSNVYEMVKSGLLESRSAQDVARLPAGSQFAFAETAVREGLPKSAIELLVTSYNDKSCPSAVKAQILSDPRTALKRMADKRRAVNADRPSIQKANSQQDVSDIIRSARLKMIVCHRVFCAMPPHEIEEHGDALKELESSMLALITMIRCIFSPGKMEVEHRVG